MNRQISASPANPGAAAPEDPGWAMSGQVPDEQPSSRLWFRPPSREQILAWVPFWGVILLGAILRFWELGAKPLHHDESLHAYFSLQLLQNTIWRWSSCVAGTDANCYAYNPLLHGPFQFHAIALTYQIARWLGAPDNGVNTFTVRIPAALLGSVLVGLPYFLRDYLGKLGAWLACFLLAVSPSMVYFSRFAREDIYMACFTLLMVVAVARYVRERRIRWLLLAAAGFALSYATSEATFLTIAVFGSFLGGLIVWEIGSKFPLRERVADQQAARFLPRTFAPVALLVYVLVMGSAAKIALGKLDQLSTYINTHTSITDADLANIKSVTVALIPWLGILLGLVVFSLLAREIWGKLPPPGRRGLARFVDRRQPVLDTILTMPWTHWFFALILAWGIFLVLFTALFTDIRGGIGSGIWQGIYYWLQQQQVARGGQPWYYYLLLIPLYEQIGVVFAIGGIVRCLWKPNTFRLFLVYWFLGDFVLYSWAGEKMPWLMIFMTMPMMLLAAVALEPCGLACARFVRERFFASSASSAALAPVPEEGEPAQTPRRLPRVGRGKAALGAFGVVLAVLLLIPTLHNMYEVTYVHAADSQAEMMVYVQTTVYVNTVMDKIAAVDQQIDGGKHQIRIGVEFGVEWPFLWYLRDYPNICLGYPTSCPSWAGNVPVVIAGDDDNLSTVEEQLGKNYRSHIYMMRGQFDQGYMPPPCVSTLQHICPPQPYSGVGPGLWLSYGDSPPPGASFNLVLALQHIWRWWWQRVPFGSTDGGNGGYYMELFIQKGIQVTP